MKWQHPSPFILEHTVSEEDLDFLRHVNNKKYLNWLEWASWQHSLSVGIDQALQQKVGKIMVVKQHELNYHAGCFLDDELLIGTWVGGQIGCCQRKRFYQIFRQSDQRLVFSGHTLWACMDLKTYRASVIPDEFIQPYLES